MDRHHPRAPSRCATRAGQSDIFDAHCHIIDTRYPIIPNQGYTPPSFPLAEYQKQTQRGRVDTVDDIVQLATRAQAAGRWHAEIYADAAALRPHVAKLSKLPQIVIDHLGMTEEGLPVVLDLVDAGSRWMCLARWSGSQREIRLR